MKQMEKLGTATFRGSRVRSTISTCIRWITSSLAAPQFMLSLTAFHSMARTVTRSFTLAKPAIYQTEFEDHHKRACFVQRYANCICIHLDDEAESRLKKEYDLVREQSSLCQG